MRIDTTFTWLIWLLLVVPAFFSCGPDPAGTQDETTRAPATIRAVDDDDDDVFQCAENHPDRSTGLILCQTGAFEGYTLFAPMGSTTTYLVDMLGNLVHTWESAYMPGESVYLLEDGTLLRTIDAGPNPVFTGGGKGGGVQMLNWDSQVLWEYTYSDETHCQHHDAKRLPNGNVLMIAWERFTNDQAIAAGRDPSLLSEGQLWPDTIIEIEPKGIDGGDIVWTWRVWDHLIQDHDASKDNFGPVDEHPERIDLNYMWTDQADWNHVNAVDYHPQHDQIMLTVRSFCEIWVIDHSLPTEATAGHEGGRYGRGGDLLYRWGNPEAWRAGTEADRVFYYPHDGNWIEPGMPGAGNILVFNNGLQRTGSQYSTIDQIAPPMNALGSYDYEPGVPFGPQELAWTYVADPPDDLYSSLFSGADRLPNGNTLICQGANGEIFEVTGQGKIVWNYINPYREKGADVGFDPPTTSTMLFRAYRYAPDYSGLAGQDLSPVQDADPKR